MSGNINDTNINKLRQQIDGLKKEIDNILSKNENVVDWESSLQNKYKNLFNTSKTLFKYIVTNYGTEKFNEQFFNQTVSLMFNRIASIQGSEVTQEDASSTIGLHLARKFIPQMRKQDDNGANRN